MKAMIAFFGQVPTAADAIRANLKTPMPKSFIDYGVAGFNGLGDFYAGDARQAFADVDDKGLQQQFADASAKAAKAMHDIGAWLRSEEHTSELQSLMRISYAVFCLTKKTKKQHNMHVKCKQ